MPPVDNRLLDAPMRPVRCQRCQATVQARKASWQQTSIQWSAAAMASCEERRTALRTTSHTEGHFATCQALRATIQRAAGEGDLEIREPTTEEKDDL